MCARCAELLAAAHTATMNHIRLLSKPQLAKLTWNREEVTALTALLSEAIAARHESTLRGTRARFGIGSTATVTAIGCGCAAPKRLVVGACPA